MDRNRQAEVDGEESRGGDYRLRGSCLVEGLALFDQQTGGGEAEKPLMLIVGSGLNSPL